MQVEQSSTSAGMGLPQLSTHPQTPSVPWGILSVLPVWPGAVAPHGQFT